MAIRIGVMMGDPAGVGAELTAKLLASGAMSVGTGVVIVGDPVHLARGKLAVTHDDKTNGTQINMEAIPDTPPGFCPQANQAAEVCTPCDFPNLPWGL